MWSAIVLPSNKSWFGKGRKSVQFKKKFTNKGTWGKTWFWPLFDYLIYDMVFLRNTILIMNNRDVPGRRHLGKADVCVCADFKELGKYVSRLAVARHLVVRAAWDWDSLCLGWFGLGHIEHCRIDFLFGCASISLFQVVGQWLTFFRFTINKIMIGIANSSNACNACNASIT